MPYKLRPSLDIHPSDPLDHAASHRRSVLRLKGLRPAREVPVSDVICTELTIPVVLSVPVEETFRAVEIIESGHYPSDRMHTRSLPLEQAEDASTRRPA